MTDQNRTAHFHCIRQTGISTLSVEILLTALLSFHEYCVEGYAVNRFLQISTIIIFRVIIDRYFILQQVAKINI